ncbi:Flagella basal body P-ring formation protein FlgA precursor [Variovorax sp. PBL-H6]|uniref:flagellar basal body P-ring formation chaperone FlgA n=1 Tax=Variovorax sp. PBL-H6 TaxID=434009 RepID=UPI0013161844|nr:flagellar basal body P-ring formation chaperone FlgA [Variovorax sp. PBL-H6]VTU22238.1 Flagella basal body P-ring formation protein FlgA precursor [Variovorax sp. PBL-H6]
MMDKTRFFLCFLPVALAAALGAGASLAAPQEDNDARRVVEQLLKTQTAGLPGQARIRVRLPGSPLPPCEALEAFLPNGASAWGRVSVGLRCPGERPWTRYVQAHVALEGRYLVAARAIEAGRPLGAADVAARTGDLTALPKSILVDPADLQGMVAANRIAPGAPLRREQLRGTVVIQQGQTVQVVAEGAGFTVSTAARALSRAEIGALVRAKTRDGRLVSGVADEEGQIRLAQ